MNLTRTNHLGYADPTVAKSTVGFGSPFRHGARALCQQVHGFFYALILENRKFRLFLFIMVGVAGSRKACRNHVPVYQPVTLTALSLVAPVGDYSNHRHGDHYV